MHQDDRATVLALKVRQRAEETRDIMSAVLIQSMETYQWIQEEQLGPDGRERRLQSSPITLDIQSQDRLIDYEQVERQDVEPSADAQRFESGPHRRQWVLG